MDTTFFTTLNAEEFKNFLKQSIAEILNSCGISKSSVPDILDMRQAAEFLRLKVTTLYEKTSKKLIPHFKKGNKLYFKRGELQNWIEEGKTKTKSEMQADAASHCLHKEFRNNSH